MLIQKRKYGKRNNENDMTAFVAQEIVDETDKAYKVACMSHAWIPKSQVENIAEQEDGTLILTIPQWLANKKGLGPKRDEKEEK